MKSKGWLKDVARAYGRLAGGLLFIVMGSAAVQAADYRLGTVSAVESPVGKAAVRFADLVRERTNGEVNIKVFPAGQVGDDVQMIRDLSRGLLDFSFSNYGSAVALDKRIDIGALPYVVTNYEEADKIFYGNGVIPRTAIGIMNKIGLHFLAWYELEFRAVSNSSHPITSMAEIRGLKLRAPPSQVLRLFLDGAGAQTVTLPLTETFTALQQGAVHGQDNGPIMTYSSKLYENTKYMTLTHHAFITSAVVMSQALKKKLSQAHLEIIEGTAKEVARGQVQQSRVAYEKAIADLRAAGVQVIQLSPAAMQEMRKFGISLWDKMAPIYGADSIAELRREVEALK